MLFNVVFLNFTICKYYIFAFMCAKYGTFPTSRAPETPTAEGGPKENIKLEDVDLGGDRSGLIVGAAEPAGTTAVNTLFANFNIFQIPHQFDCR